MTQIKNSHGFLYALVLVGMAMSIVTTQTSCKKNTGDIFAPTPENTEKKKPAVYIEPDTPEKTWVELMTNNNYENETYLSQKKEEEEMVTRIRAGIDSRAENRANQVKLAKDQLSSIPKEGIPTKSLAGLEQELKELETWLRESMLAIDKIDTELTMTGGVWLQPRGLRLRSALKRELAEILEVGLELNSIIYKKYGLPENDQWRAQIQNLINNHTKKVRILEAQAREKDKEALANPKDNKLNREH